MLLNKKSDAGFTLIELIIVVVVIAVLSVVAVPLYSGIQGDAKTVSAQSDFRNSSQRLEMFHAENNRYPTALPRELENVITASKKNFENTSPSGTNFLYCSNGQNYLLYAISSNGDRIQQSSRYGATTRTVSSNNAIACPAFGVEAPYSMVWLNDRGTWNSIVR